MCDMQKKYAELVVAMATDYLMGDIAFQTFLNNLEMIVMQLQEMEYDKEADNKNIEKILKEKLLC